MFDLTGKCALVTGASGGIGGAIAKALHAQGATVALSGTRVDPLNALAAELGDRAHVTPCNLGDAEAVSALAGQASEAMGGLHILVNNAGITRDNIFMRMKDEEWQDVIDVNLTSTMRLMKSVMRPMMKQKFGRIINITSIVGVTGNAGQVNYAASKAGMIGMTKSYAQEIATRGITANCVAPGFIDGDWLWEGLGEGFEQAKQERAAQNALGKVCQPDDIAAAIVGLIQGSDLVTGQTLICDGVSALVYS